MVQLVFLVVKVYNKVIYLCNNCRPAKCSDLLVRGALKNIIYKRDPPPELFRGLVVKKSQKLAGTGGSVKVYTFITYISMHRNLLICLFFRP